jgi:hypothetical protein
MLLDKLTVLLAMLGIISLGYFRFKSAFSSAFLVSLFLAYPMIDFILRSEEELKDLKNTSLALGVEYAPVMAIIALVVYTTSLMITWNHQVSIKRRITYLFQSSFKNSFFLKAAFFAVLIDILLKFAAANFNLNVLGEEVFAPRGSRPWEQLQYSGNVIYSISRFTVPLAGLLCIISLFEPARLTRLCSSSLLIVVICLLVIDYSRTPVVVLLALTGLAFYLRAKGLIKKILIIAMFLVIISVLTSFMLQTRGAGISETRVEIATFNSYHQDDSFIRAANALGLSEKGYQNWDPSKFAYTILVNPIPRVLWPEKPILEQDFFGQYKLFYTTIWYFGEIFAMFGMSMGIFVSLILTIILLKIVSVIMKRANSLGEFAIVTIWCLYFYLCTRSLMNISFAIYQPLVLTVLFYLYSLVRKERVV